MRIVTTSLFLLAVGALAGCAKAQAPRAPVQLVSGNTQLSFAPQGKGYALTHLTDRSKKRDFITASPNVERKSLWTIEFRPPNGKQSDAVIVDEASLAVTPKVAQTKGLVRFDWKGLSIGSQANAADVTVTVAAVKGSSMTDWRISVNSRATGVGVWQIDFPRVSRLFVSPKGEAATPVGMGMVVSDPVQNASMGFNQRYPEALYSMQFASLSDQGSCLYLGTHDPHANIKEMSFLRGQGNQSLNYQIRQFPPNMGVPGRNYAQPYPALLGVIGGDWVDAAKYYRKWVLKNSDWMRHAKPMAQRTDVPTWFKRLPLWVGLHGITDETVKQTEAFLRYMDVPAAVHVYHWHQIPHDHKYPDFWPPMPLAEDAFKRIHALGGKVMPYTNAHLMDEKSNAWKTDDAARFAVMNPDGTLDGQIVDENRHLNAMCPATSYWQTKLDPLSIQLVRDLKVDGIYLDQIAAITPSLCFNPNHGHPVGGGSYWVSGHNRQIANVRKAAGTVKPNVFLTTESAAEPFNVDAYLRVNETAPFLTPIWQLVYSDYRLSFGFYFYEQPEWIAKFATQYLWGMQIGWAGQHDPAAMPEIAAFEREVARARYAGSDYLAMGEMLRDPQIRATKGELPRYTTTWQNFATKMPIDWPAVKGSTWRAPNGSVGLALVNLHGESQEATVTLNRKDIGFAKGKVRVRALYPRDMMPAQIIDGNSLTTTVRMPATSAALVVLEPVNAAATLAQTKSQR